MHAWVTAEGGLPTVDTSDAWAGTAGAVQGVHVSTGEGGERATPHPDGHVDALKEKVPQEPHEPPLQADTGQPAGGDDCVQLQHVAATGVVCME